MKLIDDLYEKVHDEFDDKYEDAKKTFFETYDKTSKELVKRYDEFKNNSNAQIRFATTAVIGIGVVDTIILLKILKAVSK